MVDEAATESKERMDGKASLHIILMNLQLLKIFKQGNELSERYEPHLLLVYTCFFVVTFIQLQWLLESARMNLIDVLLLVVLRRNSLQMYSVCFLLQDYINNNIHYMFIGII